MRFSMLVAAMVLVLAVVLAILLPNVHGYCHCPFKDCCPINHRIALRIGIAVVGVILGAAILAFVHRRMAA